MAIIRIRDCNPFSEFPALSSGAVVDLDWLNLENSKSHFALRGELAVNQVGGRVNGVTFPLLGARGGASWAIPGFPLETFMEVWLPHGYNDFTLLVQYRNGQRSAIIPGSVFIPFFPRLTVELIHGKEGQTLMDVQAGNNPPTTRTREITGRLSPTVVTNYQRVSRRFLKLTWDPSGGNLLALGGLVPAPSAANYDGFMLAGISFFTNCKDPCRGFGL